MTLRKNIFAVTIGLLLATGTAFADSAANEDGLAYIVQPGDTLYEISEQYLENPKHWRELAEGANVKNPVRLQPGHVLHLPIDQLRHERKELRVAFQRGDAKTVVAGKTKTLSRGEVITEGQIIRTGADGFVSLELPDGSKIFLSADSELKIKQFRHVPDVNKDLIEFVLEKGSVETSVTPQNKDARFRVSTPLTVTGVRGTTFGVSYNKGVQTNNVTEGAVDVTVADKNKRAQQGGPVRISAGQGAMMTANMLTPKVERLLPAPDLSQWPAYIHAEVWMPIALDSQLASGYAVQVIPENALHEVTFDSKGNLVPIGPLADGVYTIEVRAFDQYRVPGEIASHKVRVKTKPDAPMLQAPENDIPLVVGSQELLCTNAPGIDRYYLEVATDAQFENKVAEMVSTNGCRFTVDLKELRDYYWRVASVEGASSDIDASRGGFGAVGNFNTIPVPVVPSNASQEKSKDGIVLRWVEATAGSKYVVELSEDSSFADVLGVYKADETMVALNVTQSCQKMYVRIKSIEPSGYASEFSAAQELQTTQTWCSSDGEPILGFGGEPITIN